MEKFQRTCRYGHGALVNVDKLHGQPVHFGLIWWPANEGRSAQYLTGLRWYFCPVCGYTEMQDPDPVQTLRHMGGAHG